MNSTWGICTTTNAQRAQILRFAAHHLDAGARRLYLYLDDPDSDAYAPLKAHSKIRVFKCDATHWKKLGDNRPSKHQVRQSRNATHAYARKTEVDWLMHIDVDEFVVSQDDVSGVLSRIPSDAKTARVRPMEQLAGDGTSFKAFVPGGPQRNRIVQALYPEFGPFLKGGFMSHVAGKLFVRTGLKNVEIRIHNALEDDAQIPNEIELSAIDLAHCHAKDCDSWLETYRYRLEKGSYRGELAATTDRENHGVTLHEMFKNLEHSEGEAGLRRFYEDVATDTPALRARLKEHGMYRNVDLDLDAKLARHFPDFV